MGEAPLEAGFASRLLAWHAEHGRHDLPWQQPRTPYRVWVAEIMLQQTQVRTVIPYFQRFMQAFPSVEALAAAELDAVLALWQGLGYYARARNLHRAARQMVAQGGFPQDRTGWEALPGIGRSTAAAIMAQAYGRREAILDGNVKRVLCRLFGIEGWPGERTVEQRLWALAERLLPQDEGVMPDYTQAQMDLGATLCTRARPDCVRCPFADDCIARREGRTGELPAARPRRALPVRTVNWQVQLHEGRVWLVQRPPQGVWGGLWTLPEVDAPRGEALPAFRHTFTHFHLDIMPWLWHSDAVEPAARGRWWPLNEALAAGIPAPVKRILEEVEHEPQGALRQAEAGTGRAGSSAVSGTAGSEGV